MKKPSIWRAFRILASCAHPARWSAERFACSNSVPPRGGGLFSRDFHALRGDCSEQASGVSLKDTSSDVVFPKLSFRFTSEIATEQFREMVASRASLVLCAS